MGMTMIETPGSLSEAAAAAAAHAGQDSLLAGLAVQVVAAVTRTPPEDIVAVRRPGGRALKARNLAMYLAHVGFGWPLQRVGAAFGRDRTTAGIACRQVEDDRDDPQLDALLDRLESCLREVADTPSAELA